MPTPIRLDMDPKNSCLLVMDYQRSVVDRFATDPLLLDRMARAIAFARQHGIPVGYVVVGFRPGLPEIHPRNPTFSALRAQPLLVDPRAREIHPRVGPTENEWVVTKHRVGAFEGTDLDMILRASDRHLLVLAGIATSGVVLSTLRAAADRDYRVAVLDDCCADPDAEVHRVLMTKVFPRQAEVLDSDSWMSRVAKKGT
jgi:nicotinamidase-related amidase